MNNTTVKHQPPIEVHLLLKLTGKQNSSTPSKQVEENPLKPLFTNFQQELKNRKLEVDTCSITNNLVKISFCDYSKSSHELDLNPITNKLVECFEKNLDQIADIKLTLHPYQADLKIEMSHKFTMFLTFFKEFKEILLNYSWASTSFHWSKKNGLLTALTVENPAANKTSSNHKCDNDLKFIENSLNKFQYDEQHVEMTRKKCSIKLKTEIIDSRN